MNPADKNRSTLFSMFLFFSLFLFASPSIGAENTSPITQVGALELVAPKATLTEGSVQIRHIKNLPFSQWNEKDHRSFYQLMKKVALLWKSQGIKDYTGYGSEQKETSSFTFDAIPYPKEVSSNRQAALILWRLIFGRQEQSKEEIDQLAKQFESIDSTNDFVTLPPSPGDDVFCQKEVIERQLIYEGNTVNILYNYAPLGYFSEQLHFLIVPKEHKERFEELTEEEFVEISILSQALYAHFQRKNNPDAIHNDHLHLQFKVGKHAHQTVPHWHQHVLLTANSKEDFLVFLNVLQKTLVGSRPLSKEELLSRIASFQSKLNNSSSVFSEKIK